MFKINLFILDCRKINSNSVVIFVLFNNFHQRKSYKHKKWDFVRVLMEC